MINKWSLGEESPFDHLYYNTKKCQNIVVFVFQYKNFTKAIIYSIIILERWFMHDRKKRIFRDIKTF